MDFVLPRSVKKNVLNSSKIFQYQLIRKIYFEAPRNTYKFQWKSKEILKTNPKDWRSKYLGEVYKEATIVNTLLVLFLGYLKLIKSFDCKDSPQK